MATCGVFAAGVVEEEWASDACCEGGGCSAGLGKSDNGIGVREATNEATYDARGGSDDEDGARVASEEVEIYPDLEPSSGALNDKRPVTSFLK